MRRLLWMCAIALLALDVAPLLAQSAREGPAPRPVATRQDWFSIPFHIATASRPDRQPTEVQLFASDDGGRTWQLHERVSPQAGQVNFQAMRDGQYCFCVRTLDRSGRMHPSHEMRPEMIVVVDTTSPQISLTTERGSDGAVTAEWRIEEKHLNKDSLKVEYKIGENDWRPLVVDTLDADSDEVHTGTATWWPASSTEAVAVRATVLDIAGNRADHQSRLEAVSRATALDDSVATMQRPGDLSTGGTRTANKVTPAADARPNERYAMRYGRPKGTQQVFASDPRRSAAETSGPTQPVAAPGTVADPVRPSVSQQFSPLEGPNLAGSERLPPGERPRMVNSSRFELEYEVESIGPSGIGKVHLWGTQDGGQTWRSFGIDADNRSPLPVNVDGEGLYGFRIVVESGSGLHGRLPQAGDQPEVWVGVDMSEPDVELISARQGTGEQAGLLLVAWRADDAQLAVRPVSLLIRGQADGTWSPIASGLPNSGRFAWPLDNRVPDQIVLRLEVRDEAGNMRIVESDEPLTLDRARPQGRIRGVRSLPPGAEARRGLIHNPYYR